MQVRFLRATVLAFLLVCVTTASALAQGNNKRHEGFTWAIGAGMGSLTSSCTGCSPPSSTDRALAATLRGGWVLNDALIIAADGLIFRKTQVDNENTNYQSAAAVALWYPSHKSGYFFKAGGGMTHTTITLAPSIGQRRLTSTAPMVRLGLGADAGFGSAWALTPYVDYLLGMTSSTDVNAVKVKLNMLLFGVTVTFK